MSDDKDKRWAEALKRSLDKTTRDQLLYGNWVQGETVSTVSTQPNQSMTIEHLREAIEDLKKGDALQQKGIGKDWVCVINPKLEQPIKELSKQYIKVPTYVMAGFELNYIMGRRTFIINEAPLNVEYMDEKTARFKYPSHFEETDLPIAINRVKRIIELNEEVYLSVRIEGEWTFFRYYITENDPEPFQVKRIATKIFDEMDWSYAAMLIMQAPPEPKS